MFRTSIAGTAEFAAARFGDRGATKKLFAVPSGGNAV